jgi:hypothetical protein|uniref:RING-type domain-containing protein n=1 Tax=viral metagenome TaxID=1070528 RepID=A0A6C0IPP4_9ZZZZ
MIEETEVHINTEKGTCDCCMDDNVEILTCSSNNKCEYAMCDTCIKNIKTISRQKSCPHCREEIFSSSDDSDELTVYEGNEGNQGNVVERNYVRIKWCPCCLIERRLFERTRRTFRDRLQCIINVYCIQPVICCLYCGYSMFIIPIVACYFGTQTFLGIKNIKNEKIRTFVTFLSLIIIGAISSLCSRLYYMIVMNLSIDSYWPVLWYVFVIQSLLGLAFIIITAFALTFAIGCFCTKCTDVDDSR